MLIQRTSRQITRLAQEPTQPSFIHTHNFQLWVYITLWDENETAGKNPSWHRDNMQTSHRGWLEENPQTPMLCEDGTSFVIHTLIYLINLCISENGHSSPGVQSASCRWSCFGFLCDDVVLLIIIHQQNQIFLTWMLLFHSCGQQPFYTCSQN